LINRLSELRPRTPNGPGMWRFLSFLPAMSITASASWLIDTISSEPTLNGPVWLERIRVRVPSVHSSMYRNERVCSPSPQISISPFLDSATLRQIAAGAFSLPPAQVPSGPNMLW